jgi:UDP-N-acetylmuramoyl-tripeptide--D-alanyl-D-alanine ligase
MYELGPGAAAYHGAVGEHAARLGVRVVAVGDLARHYLTGAPGERWMPTVEECLAKLGEVVPPGAAVLVKASRALRLERVAEAIRAAASAAAAGEATGAQNGEADEASAGDPPETGDGRATEDGEEAGDA